MFLRNRSFESISARLGKKRKCSESVDENSPSNTDKPYVPSEPSTESEESCSRYITFMFFNSKHFIKKYYTK